MLILPPKMAEEESAMMMLIGSLCFFHSWQLTKQVDQTMSAYLYKNLNIYWNSTFGTSCNE